MKRNLIFLGPPGAGKGTFAGVLTRQLGIVHVSTGEIFRNEIKSETELGKIAKKYVESGHLVPDEIVVKMVLKRLANSDCKAGFILDGFPRTLEQAKSLDEAIKKTHIKIDLVICFESSDDLLIKRLTARLTCRNCGEIFNKLFSPPKTEGTCDKCGVELYQRADDGLETVKNRLALYKEQTEPLIEYYTKERLIYSLNSEQNKDAVLKKLITILG